MKALLIDHDDSFTFNLQDWLKPIFSTIEVCNHRDLEKIQKLRKEFNFNLIVLSPGPKHPQDYPHVLAFLNSLPSSQPVLGVCLGMQLMAHLEAEMVRAYLAPLHGKKSQLTIIQNEIKEFEQLMVARYHSLYCDFKDNSNFKILALSDSLPMWITHKSKKWLGLQFHPESFMTEKPELHLKYLKKWCKL